MLNVGLEDFLNAEEQGRWWIVGSAWQKQNPQNNNKNNIQKVEPQFNDTIRKLAKKQHMNTDVRRLIFGTLLTSEYVLVNNGKMMLLLVTRIWKHMLCYIIMKNHKHISKNTLN